ncbi:MAG TPA: VWA domain-containing protein [Bryobacteraceae bacterium]|nr:VWA domain-containing protein [Bryobacteraceae bacterium]
MTGARWACWAGVFCACASLGAAQQSSDPKPAAAPQPPISVQVNEVIVPVTVTDMRGRFISDLDKKDFQIFDQGKPQKIRFFSRERNQPVVVGFLMDLSNSSRIHWKNYVDAATNLIWTLLPGNEKYSGYLIGYGTSAEVLVNTTTDPEKLVDKLKDVKPGGGSALYDAIYESCTSRKLVKGEPVEPRRVLVVIGDGHDNSSKKTLDQVLELAQRNLVTIYGVSTLAYGATSEGDDNLQRLADATGGRVEYPLQNVYKDVAGYLEQPQDAGNFAYQVGTGGYASALSNSIFTAIANIAGEITTQYILRYVPDIPPGSEKQFREINVKVSLPDVKVRARKGYYPFTP